MATWYIDYSAARLSSATIKSTPVGPDGEKPVGVIRYVDAPEFLQTKHTNLAEYGDLVRSGLNMDAMYFERGYEDPNGGFAGGVENAKRALKGANWLGFKGVILMCCDRWFIQAPHNPVTAARWQAYLDGAVSILGRGRVGAYGFRDAIDAAQGHVDYFVQCGSRSVLHPNAHGWQDNRLQPKVGGIGTDRVQIFKSLAAKGSTPTPSVPETVIGDDEMIDRIEVPASSTKTTLRIQLGGGANARIVVRPKITFPDTTSPNKVFVGHIFAWGSDNAGIGFDPLPGDADSDKVSIQVNKVHTFNMPNGTWCDFEYSSLDPFILDVF